MRSRSSARRARAVLALGICVALLPSGPALARPVDDAYRPQVAQRDPSVPGTSLKPVQQSAPPGSGAVRASAPVWPAASTAVVDVSGAAAASGGPGVRAGESPVFVARAEGAAAGPGRVRVQVLDQQVVRDAGWHGVGLRVTRADGSTAAGRVRVTVDYTGFRDAVGADWSTRLRLVARPGCALTTPERPECQGRALASRNDTVAGVVSADVDLPGGSSVDGGEASDSVSSTLVTVEAAPSGPAGNYGATNLAPSSTWSAGGSSGGFSWSYPMRVPPSLGGPAPSVALQYASDSVDGRMAASNSQPSWIGEGFEWSPGYIERRYVPCAEDPAGGNRSTRDLCWATDNALLSLNGRTSELLKDGDGRWHRRIEDGSRIELETGAVNGAKDGEHWVVTAADGTQYWFGKNQLPGWVSGRAVTNSTLTTRVYANNPNEPCVGDAGSYCVRAWRWNLDWVVDPRGNAMSLWWGKESNKYAVGGNPSVLAAYDRAGYLTRIDYGLRSDNAYATAPMRVVFTPRDRCVTSSCATHDKVNWPDTPWDFACSAAPCYTGAPTFWTTKRLGTVTTKVWTGSGTTYRDAESWTLTHEFKDPGDTTRAGLWLARIAHAGGSQQLPDVTFDGVQMANRVDATDHSPPMNRWRIHYINTELGGRIAVTYKPPDCVAGTRVPTQLHDNRLRCYPVRWTPEGATNEVNDLFHKYVVEQVTQTDRTTASPTAVVTAYEYPGDPAWHYTDDDGLIKDSQKTWSVWRGYDVVETTVGDAGEQTVTRMTFFRGMNGDKLPSGERSVTMPAKGGAPAVADEDAYAGLARETITYDGAAEVSGTVSEPWQSSETATRTRNGLTVTARFRDVAVSRTRTARDGGRADLSTVQRSTFDSHGMLTQVDDEGDTAVTGDERCTKTNYVRNTTGSLWLTSYIERTRSYAVGCTRAGQGGLTEAHWIADTRTSYDNLAFGAAPTKGLVTKVEELNGWDQNTQTPTYLTTTRLGYDDIYGYGRVTSSTDVRGNVTTTAYTPASAAPVTSTTATTRVNDVDWRTTTTVDPAWGYPTATVDPNGRRTDLEYDGLGRLTGVWLPGRNKAAGATASTTYGYKVYTNAASVVSTATLTPAGSYLTSYALIDGLGRSRQTQAPEAGDQGGRILTDTFYDSAGRAFKTYNPYATTGSAGETLFRPTDDQVIPSMTTTLFDGAGRTTANIFSILGVEKWRTTTGYGGDRVDTTPPAGGTATSVYTDARGRTTDLRQYTDAAREQYQQTSYTHNNKDQLVKVTDTVGNQWQYRFDLRGRQTWASDPDKGETTLTYNDFGDLRTTRDSRDITLAHTYDSLGRKTSLREGSDTGPKRAEWTYDPVVNNTPVLGQLGSSTRWVGEDAYTTRIRDFAADYQPTQVSYTIPAAAGDLAGTYTYRYQYKVNGVPDSVTVPDLDGPGGLTGEQLTFGYNTITGAPYSLSTDYGGTESSYVASTTYTRYGEPAVSTMVDATNKVVQVGRYYSEGTRRLDHLWVTRTTSPSTISDQYYTQDPAGNITEISDQTSSDHQCFSHDRLRRLTDAWTPADGVCTTAPAVNLLGGPAKYWSSWTFDATGNRETQTTLNAAATGRTTTNYHHPAAGSPQPHTLTSTDGAQTGSYTYDDAGNTRTRPAPGGGTQTLTWDAEGHLASSADGAGTVQYTYDADGNRLIGQDPGGSTLYLPGQELRVTTTGAKATTRYYSHGGQTVAMRTASSVIWLAADHQGTAQHSITTGTQAVATRRRTPYGTPRGTVPTWPNDKGLVGGTQDATGLTHLGAREYDPNTGRFISVDPLMDLTDPQQMHGYAYANNSPITASDPSGLIYTRKCLEECGSDEDRRWQQRNPAPTQTRSARQCVGSENSGGCRRPPEPPRCVGSENSGGCHRYAWARTGQWVNHTKIETVQSRDTQRRRDHMFQESWPSCASSANPSPMDCMEFVPDTPPMTPSYTGWCEDNPDKCSNDWQRVTEYWVEDEWIGTWWNDLPPFWVAVTTAKIGYGGMALGLIKEHYWQFRHLMRVDRRWVGEYEGHWEYREQSANIQYRERWVFYGPFGTMTQTTDWGGGVI